ncbi:hypothetical protein Cantr_00832 [Candida viswanathii]|uniref:Vacuolar protein sorting-associated protein 51 n=1 Tax=Candida viswanathii TaxID=5486 RepID=A0A367YHQ7_9ASCO|nr:hypothetical protein Cantr_00832 [Candida viswanathii]
MADSPVLSYKKPSHNNNSSQRISSVPSTPNLSQPDSPLGFSQLQLPSSIGSPRPSTSTLPTARKVSSRRKALQEFYRLNEENHEDPSLGSGGSGSGSFDNIDISSLESIDNMIKNAPIEDILKVRNSITAKLSSSNQTKKAIIYDNYYELIKLSNTLADLTTARLAKKTDSTSAFKLYTDEDDEANRDKDELTKEEYVDKTLQELADFVSSEGSKFNGTFKEVLDNLNSSIASDNASMLTLKEDDQDELEQSEKQQIIDHINYILNLPTQEPDETAKEEAIKDIKQILADNPDNEILALQLTKIENTLL